MDKDLFGDDIKKDVLLRDLFLEPPFSVLDTKSGTWQNRKRQWKTLGIKSEIGREKSMTYSIPTRSYDQEKMEEEKAQELNTSIFDPALCELMYRWFCPEGGTILDPFAGGSVRGIVANYLGYKYTGVELRQEQVDANRENALEILPVTNQPQYYCGDSDKVLDKNEWPGKKFDLIFSCPPYADLEVYSDLPEDISNMPYHEFRKKYESIIHKACDLLKPGGYAVFVVGEVRNKKGNYYGFIPDTISSFISGGLSFYNEAILLNSIASASMRANKQFSSGKKLVKVHQNVLIFKKNGN